MHNNAHHIDENLVRELIGAQFPHWSHFDLKRINSNGTDNVIFRLGNEMCARLPLIPSASEKLNKELACLPLLPDLPLEIPTPIASGEATKAYQSPWAVYRWIEGIEVNAAGLNDMDAAAESVAEFVRALHESDASEIPSYGQQNNFRGCPLKERDIPTRHAVEDLSDIYNVTELMDFWEKTLTISHWDNHLVLIHGDIHAGNLLMRNGNVTAVVDFGLMGIGDPAVDLIVNWSLLTKITRERFRSVLKTDDDTWFRGRGWALSTAVIALAYYRHSNHFLTKMSKRVISEVLGDFRAIG